MWLWLRTFKKRGTFQDGFCSLSKTVEKTKTTKTNLESLRAITDEGYALIPYDGFLREGHCDWNR